MPDDPPILYDDQLPWPEDAERCRGKRKYDKKGAVTVKNDRMRRAHTPLRVYNCPDCHGWHVTSRDPYRK
jgi:hypothetical protein